ncbi:NAD(P)-dependent oxidoreductase [Pseudomonadota bacterium]
MSELHPGKHTIGWIGTGRMGFAMAKRLLTAGFDVSVYNRTRSKAEPLEEFGAHVVDTPRDLSDRDFVFTMVSGPPQLIDVVCGDQGVLSGDSTPRMLIDSSSVSEEASNHVRKELEARGCDMLSAPVSGNAKVIQAGKLTMVVSGPKAAFETARQSLEVIGAGVTYAGEGELARMVKICHNLLLGVVTQSLAEILVLAEKGGVSRHALLDFINDSVMGSTFTRYKSPALVNLDWKVTFTAPLLCKDMDLGLSAAKKLGVPMAVAQTARDIVQQVIDGGETDRDFAILLQHQADMSSLNLTPENVDVDDGLTNS